MTTTTLAPRRTAWDVIFGLILVAAGIFLLGNSLLATAISLWVIGWTNLFSGVLLLVASLFRIKSGGFLSAALGGAFLTVIGLFILRNPVAGAVALTLAAGVAFFAGGLTRLAWAFSDRQGRLALFVSGLVSLGLGFFVLFNVGTATVLLLGTLLGVQTLLEGLTLIAVGRLRAPKEVKA
ncbi:MAG: HdeD family acid-resistance protein [Actinomycetes bacterium]